MLPGKRSEKELPSKPLNMSLDLPLLLKSTRAQALCSKMGDGMGG